MWFLYGFALLAGLAGALAPGQNASLAKSFANPLLAGVVSLLIGLLTIVAVMLAIGPLGLPSAEQAARTPWWAWLGGVFSALLAMAQLTVSKRIGAAPFLGLLVTSGVITSILLDHYGLVGFKIHAAGLWRVLGGGLMVAGVVLVARF